MDELRAIFAQYRAASALEKSSEKVSWGQTRRESRENERVREMVGQSKGKKMIIRALRSIGI